MTRPPLDIQRVLRKDTVRDGTILHGVSQLVGIHRSIVSIHLILGTRGIAPGVSIILVGVAHSEAVYLSHTGLVLEMFGEVLGGSTILAGVTLGALTTLVGIRGTVLGALIALAGTRGTVLGALITLVGTRGIIRITEVGELSTVVDFLLITPLLG